MQGAPPIIRPVDTRELSGENTLFCITAGTGLSAVSLHPPPGATLVFQVHQSTQDIVRVGPAQCGLGVFALCPLHVEELIGQVCGKLMTDPDYGSEYCMEFGEGLAIEPIAPFRYVNHSCQPNCGLIEVEVEWDDDQPGGNELLLEALSEIATGEQLTIDYAWPAEVAVRCRCGSPDCRGWIVAEEQVGRPMGPKGERPDSTGETP